ncbi:MAG: hypothetical protein WCS20_05325 [Alphaproteobacteria bacterium]|jgi:hypothetical protein
MHLRSVTIPATGQVNRPLPVIKATARTLLHRLDRPVPQSAADATRVAPTVPCTTSYSKAKRHASGAGSGIARVKPHTGINDDPPAARQYDGRANSVEGAAP